MSTIKVEVTTIRDVRPHPNADALELATVGGWQICVKKDAHRSGDTVVYFEAGTILPRDVAERLGVERYLAQKLDIHGDRVNVVHRIRLRGEPSFGLVIPPEPGMCVGEDVAARYGASKFYPPVKTKAGDADVDDPRFQAYTEIENLRSYPDVLIAGEEVVITEKIHGTNCRVGFVVDVVDGQRECSWMAGSKSLRRKRPADEAAMAQNTYWFPLTLAPVRTLLHDLFASGHEQAILFGEVFGSGIQSYAYDQKSIAFRAFDLMVDRRYLAHDAFLAACARAGVEVVPPAYRGPFDLDLVKQLSEGPSLLGGRDPREGVVVKPLHERTHAAVGRLILKYISDTYLFGKAAEQDTTDR